MALSEAIHAFHFLRPFWLLTLVPLWVLAGWLNRRRVQGDHWTQIIDPELLPDLRLESGGAPGSGPGFWLALAWTLATLALAGPAWEQEQAPAYRAPATWVLLLDLSPSMMTADLAPNRITRARYVLDDLLSSARDARVALVAFGDEPYVVTPLTDDVATVHALLAPLVPDIMPTPGDNLAPAIKLAGELLKQAGTKDQRVVVLTDGFSDPAATLIATENLKSHGVKLSVVGIGLESGAPQAGDHGGFARDTQGQLRLSHLDPDLLQHLATAGGGTYVDISGLPTLIRELQERSAVPDGTSAAQDKQVSHWQDAGIWLLPPLLLVAAFLSRKRWL